MRLIELWTGEQTCEQCDCDCHMPEMLGGDEPMCTCECSSRGRPQQHDAPVVGYAMGMSELAAHVAGDLVQVPQGINPILAPCKILVGNALHLNSYPGHAITVAYSVWAPDLSE